MGLQGDAPSPKGTQAQALPKCIAGWQATSDMTREEWQKWRNACLRSVKEDPTAFH